MTESEIDYLSRNFGVSKEEIDRFKNVYCNQSIEELKSSICDLDEKANAIRSEIKFLESLLVSKVAEFSVGERVLVTETNGKQSVFEIAKRSPGFSIGNVRYWGRMVKKDGSLGKLDRDISYYRIEKIRD
ncbi:MAG: hypothetical protein PHO57_03005 [Acidithiobacillus sp.]|nr:hypothetical protein [Acidithiobacillus sp.]